MESVMGCILQEGNMGICSSTTDLYHWFAVGTKQGDLTNSLVSIISYPLEPCGRIVFFKPSGHTLWCPGSTAKLVYNSNKVEPFDLW